MVERNEMDHLSALVYPITTKAQRMLFYQRVLSHPAKSTLLKALRDFNPFETWPDLNRELVTKYFQLTEETVFGRLDRTRKNYQSTKPSEIIHSAPDNRAYPNTTKNPRCWTKTHMISTDISGIIQKKYYFLILFFQDLNYIMFEWLGTSKSGATYRAAYLRVLERYEATPGGKDNTPHFELLDNAADTLTRDMLVKRKISYQLVPANNHRRNPTERAMRTGENHLTCTFQGADKDFPDGQEHLLIPQAEDTLNLLRECTILPGKSAWYGLHQRDYNWDAAPMAPGGCPVIVFEGPDQRRLMTPHGQKGFYLAPAHQHYRCYKCLVTSTNRTRITDTVAWMPYALPSARRTTTSGSLPRPHRPSA